MLQAATLDVMTNQRFRRGYWLKGARRLNPLEVAEYLRREHVVLVQPAADIPLEVSGANGTAELQASIYQPVLEALSDHRVQTIDELEKAVHKAGVAFNQLREALMF